MTNWTDVELRQADYAARAERVNREGWKWEPLAPAGGSRRRGMATIFGVMRRHLGGALVRVGVRLQRSRVAHAADPASA